MKPSYIMRLVSRCFNPGLITHLDPIDFTHTKNVCRDLHGNLHFPTLTFYLISQSYLCVWMRSEIRAVKGRHHVSTLVSIRVSCYRLLIVNTRMWSAPTSANESIPSFALSGSFSHTLTWKCRVRWIYWDFQWS